MTAPSSASGSASSPLAGRTALVTGASRGIGRAVAEALACDGARVALVARSAGALHEAAASIGPLAWTIACDISDAAAVQAMAKHVVERYGGPPDVLVNNAGVFPLVALDAMTVADFERTVDVNLVAPFRVLRALLPDMRARGSGHIVTIGSVADRSVYDGNGAYSASKYGQRAMHEVLRLETRGSGIRCSLIAPAATDTPIWDPLDPDHRAGFPARAAMLRPSDVADAVCWAVTRGAAVNVDEIRLSSS